MTAPHILLTAVDRRRGYVDATVTPRPGQEAHRIGYLRGEKPEWFCICPRGPQCRYLADVQALVPPMEDQP